MAFTRTPFGAQSSESALVSSSTPPLEAQYGTERFNPTLPATDEILITEPLPCSTIGVPRYLQQRKSPVRLVSMMVCHSSSVVRSTDLKIGLMPALFASTSMRPQRASTA